MGSASSKRAAVAPAGEKKKRGAERQASATSAASAVSAVKGEGAKARRKGREDAGASAREGKKPKAGRQGRAAAASEEKRRKAGRQGRAASAASVAMGKGEKGRGKGASGVSARKRKERRAEQQEQESLAASTNQEKRQKTERQEWGGFKHWNPDAMPSHQYSTRGAKEKNKRAGASSIVPADPPASIMQVQVCPKDTKKRKELRQRKAEKIRVKRKKQEADHPVLDGKDQKYQKLAAVNRAARELGGIPHLREQYRAFDTENKRRKAAGEPALREDGRFTEYRAWRELFRAVSVGAPSAQPVSLEGCKKLLYNHGTCNSEKKMVIDGKKVPFEFDPMTTGTVKGKEYPSLEVRHVSNLSQPRITPEGGSVQNVQWDSGEEVTVFFCKEEGNNCPVLDRLWDNVYGEKDNGQKLSDHLDKVPDDGLDNDVTGGGKYFPSGLGNMAAHPAGDPKGYKRGTPYTISGMGKEGADDVHTVLADIMADVDRVLQRHLPHVYQENENLKSLNARCAYPSLTRQDSTEAYGVMANQVIVRVMGDCKVRKHQSREQMKGSLHCDKGDWPTPMPLVYLPGSKGGRGGRVGSTDVVVCESDTGGLSVRICTNTPGVVAIVVFNSNRLLHGVLSDGETDDEDAWITRIVPFFRGSIVSWMMEHPDDSPWDTFDNLI